MKISDIFHYLSSKKPVGIFSKYRWFFVIYLIVSLVIFAKLFLMSGSVSGGDWGFPDDKIQLKQYFDSLKYSWTYLGNIFGARQLSPMSIILVAPVNLLAVLGIKVSVILKIVLTLIFAFAASNMNLLLRYLKLSKWPSFIAGLIYISTPIFFNYSLMGWLYVLLSMALLPLFLYLFLRSIDERDYTFAFLASLTFTLAMLQSQTIIWYPLVMIAVLLSLIGNSKKLVFGLKHFLLIIGSFIFLNSYWLPAFLLLPDQSIVSSDIVKSTISLGTSLRLTSFNIFRLWGNLFNYQFETSFPAWLVFISFVLTALAITSFFYYRKYHHQLKYLVLILLVPFIFYFLDRDLISKLPFSNVIRDVARFSTLSTFALTVLVGITLNEIFKLRGRVKYGLIIVVGLLLLFNSYPFWSGKLFSQDNSGFDFRFRTANWPSEYQNLEAKIQDDKLAGRALFLPLGGFVSLTNDLRFNGPFKEITDVYASYSPLPGSISSSDRSQGASTEIIGHLNQAANSQDADQLYDWLKETKVNYLVLRNDMQYYNWDDSQKSQFIQNIREMIIQKRADVYFQQGDILAVKIDSADRFSVGSNLVEVNSGFSGILSDWVPPGVINEADFSQTDSELELKKLFPKTSIMTFDGQNNSFSQFQEGDPSVYRFFSVSELNQKLLTLKWKLTQQNLNKKLDQGIKTDNQTVISKIEKANVGPGDNSLYMLNLNQKLTANKVYFRVKALAKGMIVTLNGSEYLLSESNVGDNVGYINDFPFVEGINTLRVGAEIIPLFVVKPSDTQTVQPAISAKQINLTQYQLEITGIKNDFYLEFADSFNQYWQLVGQNKLFSSKIINDNNHFVSNGFANGWRIKVSDLEKTGKLVRNSDGSYSTVLYLNFYPQRFLIGGLVLSLLSLLIIVAIIIIKQHGKSSSKK